MKKIGKKEGKFKKIEGIIKKIKINESVVIEEIEKEGKVHLHLRREQSQVLEVLQMEEAQEVDKVIISNLLASFYKI